MKSIPTFPKSGIGVADGKLIKSDMFSFLQLDPELYGNIVPSAEDVRKVHGRLIVVKWSGAAAGVPLMCGGPEICPFSDDCPFVEIGKVPVARKCPIEVELIAYWKIYRIPTRGTKSSHAGGSASFRLSRG